MLRHIDSFLHLGIILGVFAVVFIAALFKSIRVVPHKMSLIVERLGKYHSTLEAGFHILFPFIDKVRYRQNLKEQAIDVPAQDCFTKDNVQVRIDGILYLQVFDPIKASYGIKDYRYATILLAQTTMRSVVGQLDLDDTFEAREQINAHSIMDAMDNQMKAEREKRAEIAHSVGEMETVINLSRAAYEEAVNISEGEKERMINEAEGQATEIVEVARATAEGIKKIAASTQLQGGIEAAKLTVSQEWISALGSMEHNAKIVMTADLTDIKKMTLGTVDALMQ